MATRITTLKDSTNTDALLPKTVLKAVADDNGNYLDQNLTASDLNSLKNGAFNTVVTHTNDLIGGALPINAAQLNGHPDTYFATNDYLNGLLTIEIIETDPFTISANTSYGGTKTISKTGFTPLGIVGLWVSTGALQIVEFFINSGLSRIDFTVRNTSSSALSSKTLKFYVLFVKDMS